MKTYAALVLVGLCAISFLVFALYLERGAFKRPPKTEERRVVSTSNPEADRKEKEFMDRIRSGQPDPKMAELMKKLDYKPAKIEEARPIPKKP